MHSRGSKRGKTWCFCSQSLQSIVFGRQGRHTWKKSIKHKRECAPFWLECGEIQKWVRLLWRGKMGENFSNKMGVEMALGDHYCLDKEWIKVWKCVECSS